jgi:uncharacterized membrane protein YccC
VRIVPDKPWLRQLYDGLERRVTPPLEEFVRTDRFAELTATLGQLQSTVSGALNSATARFWHLLNLPAGTDVQRLRRQIGALDREVRRLRLELSQREAETPEVREDADTARPVRPARPRAPRGGAQHREGP